MSFLFSIVIQDNICTWNGSRRLKVPLKFTVEPRRRMLGGSKDPNTPTKTHVPKGEISKDPDTPLTLSSADDALPLLPRSE